MDFTTPTGTVKPLPSFMTEAGVEEIIPNPILTAQVQSLKPTPEPPKPDQPQLEFGDLDSAPGLVEYSEHAAKGAGYLIRLATELEVQGQWERSLLAWERVIDSCHPSTVERTTAEDSIARIRPTLTHWNIDPEGDVPILIQLGTSRRVSGNLKEAAQKVAEFIRRDADYTLLVTPRITTSRGKKAPANAPIAVYFSGTGKAEKNQSGLQSTTPQDDQTESYRRGLLSSVYQIVRQGIGNSGGIVPPRPASQPDQPEVNFQRQVTRLHWKTFAESLLRPPAARGQN